MNDHWRTSFNWDSLGSERRGRLKRQLDRTCIVERTALKLFRRWASILVLASVAGCFSPSEPVPTGLRDYLDALRNERYRDAYDATQLPDLVKGFGPGSSLTFEHFEAFYEATPLTGYSVQEVTRLRTRSIDQPKGQETPFFEVDITLEYGERRSREVITVLGEVLPRVQVEPDRLFLRLPRGTEHITVDGVQTRVRRARIFDGSRAYPVLLLRGRHIIEAGGATATIDTAPVRVIAGDASLEREGDQSSIVRLG